ncbi:MAG: methylated-DNA--[protein]-cysteine S-methyltransferase [Lachnospiraceae bacterium]|nr:methylated-DNA--[protein]-cysteine S-methyltransferase [Lachnospiraceae bacterium]
MTDTYAFRTPIGVLEIREKNDKIATIRIQQKELGNFEVQHAKPHSDLLYEAYTQLNEYFAGKRMRFDLPLHYSGTPFQERVWNALREIPYGETRSYEDIAIAIGNKQAVRAVGQANNRNPILIMVPCHRVIRKNGNIDGFTYGTEIKKYLLELEKGHFA